MVSWVDSAELARNLGRLDLYEAVFDGQSTPRLAIILEYFANLMLGNTPASRAGAAGATTTSASTAASTTTRWPTTTISTGRSATYLPVFAEMVEDYWRNDVGEDAHFLLWSRLTHGDNAYAALPPPDTYGAVGGAGVHAHGITDPALTAAARTTTGTASRTPCTTGP